MNSWFQDPRIEKAEEQAFEAERAERRANRAAARQLYLAAAEAFASVALSVHADHPNTRSDLAIAAVASFARAGDFGQSIDFGQRVLAESDALTEAGRAELKRLVDEYSALVANSIQPVRVTARPDRSSDVRDRVRSQFKRAA
jgi:hypothetical protein